MDDPAERRQLDKFLQYPLAYARQALRYAQELGIAPACIVRSADTVRAVAQGHAPENSLFEFTSDAPPRPGKPARPRPRPMVIRDRTFIWGSQTYVMAIVNVTTDSFSGDGLWDAPGAVREKIETAISGGADVIDIGGESTRPGASKISAAEEIERVLPAIAIAREMTEIPVSIDTYKAEVARAAVEAGADLVNDVWGTTADPEMAATVAGLGCPFIITHNRAAAAVQGEIGPHFREVDYGDVVGSVYAVLERLLDGAISARISCENVILDPGIGFGKTPPQNVELMGRLEILNGLGQPLLLGASRKSFIGHTLGDGTADRLMGTTAANMAAIAQGVDIIRVHDVSQAVQAARVMDSILGRARPDAVIE